jgi:predicted DsbA family dithiol-disulfide isomerase
MGKQLDVQIWSDLACPWCYVGKRRFESALARFEHTQSVRVTWRAFELDPSAPRVRPPQNYAERLASKYGQSLAEARTRVDQLVKIAASDGLKLDFEHIRPGNTFDAHRLLHLALERGLQGALKERFFRGYLSEGQTIGEHATLVSLASEVGLDVDEASAVLASERYAREVRDDEAQAHSLGIQGVPFFVVGRRYAIEGAQPAELMLTALQRAWAELPPAADPAKICEPA